MKNLDLSRGVHQRFTGIIPGIRVRADQMLWPTEDEPARTGRYRGNNLYRDLRGTTWLSAQVALQLEESLISAGEALRKRGGGKPGEAQALVSKVKQVESIWGLDLGTISAVHAISAAGGVPISSCNASSFGGFHTEPFPVVCFCWRPEQLPILRTCAEEAGVSMWLHHRGEVVIGADYIRRLLLFAEAIISRRPQLEASSSTLGRTRGASLDGSAKLAKRRLA